MERDERDADRKAAGCQTKSDDAGEKLRKMTESQALTSRMSVIRHKIMVLSGKGGVGKSTVAANVALALAMEGKSVGLLDVDFHGPSIPTLLNLEGRRLGHDGQALLPVEFAQNIKVVSLGFLMQERDEAVIWRGPMKMGVIKQLLSEVLWGELDYLIMDFPPGTGDEPLSVAQLVPDCDGAIVVTTPQNLSTNDVRRSISFCRKLGVPVLGVIENMSGFVCPQCQAVLDIFKTGGGQRMASEMQVPFLGAIPLDPLIVKACDDGDPFVTHQAQTPVAQAFMRAVRPLLELEDKKNKQDAKEQDMSQKKIAIPVTSGILSSHFGHCESFALFDVDGASQSILGRSDVSAPPHEPGLLPAWLKEKGADIIIAGGMGSRAQGLFAQNGIQVVVGAPQLDPREVVERYLQGKLETSANICDH